MARARMDAEAAREAVVAAAEALVAVRRDAVVIVAAGPMDVICASPSAAPAEEADGYAASILSALTDTPMSARRLARAAGRTYNSYFRERLAELVETGRVRRTRRGYSRPAG